MRAWWLFHVGVQRFPHSPTLPIVNSRLGTATILGGLVVGELEPIISRGARRCAPTHPASFQCLCAVITARLPCWAIPYYTAQRLVGEDVNWLI